MPRYDGWSRYFDEDGHLLDHEEDAAYDRLHEARGYDEDGNPLTLRWGPASFSQSHDDDDCEGDEATAVVLPDLEAYAREVSADARRRVENQTAEAQIERLRLELLDIAEWTEELTSDPYIHWNQIYDLFPGEVARP